MAKSKPGFVKTPLDDLTYKVNGLAMQVQNELKPGHPEKYYQHRLATLCRDAGLQVEAEKRIEVRVGEDLIGYLYLDLWVEESLVVECKAFEHQLTNEEIGQVLTYLIATGCQVGMLYNFGRKTLEFKRILPPKQVQEWQGHLYRCIKTIPGRSLPPLDAVESAFPIRFSVIGFDTTIVEIPSPSGAAIRQSISRARRIASQPASEDIRLSAAKSIESSRSSAAESAEGIRLSVAKSVDGIRLSAAKSVDRSDYVASGVNIDAGNRAVKLMKATVQSTYGPEVLAGIGAFGGLFDASALKGMKSPVLVASTDGVGTKVKLAAQAGRYRSVGHDIVNHCINDILVQGARPLFFLDYFATSKLTPETVAEVVSGVAEACREADCALIGGETAEMPGVYLPGEFDVAGTIVGVLERQDMLPRPDIRPGDLLIGVRSSGPHTNGYSLIRKIFANVSLGTIFPELGVSLADALLASHRSYYPVIYPVLSHVKAVAHLTGGGFIENVPRVLPDDVDALVRRGSWPVPPLFTLIQQRGEVAPGEMYRVFNMGIGMVLIVDKCNVEKLQQAIPEQTFILGELVEGNRRVIFQ